MMGSLALAGHRLPTNAHSSDKACAARAQVRHTLHLPASIVNPALVFWQQFCLQKDSSSSNVCHIHSCLQSSRVFTRLLDARESEPQRGVVSLSSPEGHPEVSSAYASAPVWTATVLLQAPSPWTNSRRWWRWCHHLGCIVTVCVKLCDIEVM